MKIILKRVYEAPDSSEGLRVLVDRLWPRGLSKSKAQLDVWMKEIAPSDELRQWFSYDKQQWAEFKHRYFAELDTNVEAVKQALSYAVTGKLVLLYASKETRYNNAQALKDYLEMVAETET